MDSNAPRPKLVFIDEKPGRTIDWPCIVPVPQDGGVIAEQELVARFSLDHIGEDAHKKLLDDAIASQTPVNNFVLGKVLLGFPELKNEGGTAVSNDVSLPVFMAKPYAVVGLIRGYMAMREGRLPKNSLAPFASF